ncbi:hypothetical protein [Novosphingobium rosa]|uniref:hypothetical protein n=1 Tax=Novosphingobium rosa TaxID=76978 RepID=UPI00083035B1|nr:hypothetical protein [Novosphingobium rosa]
MTLSAAFCRAQEALQLQRAASEPLENVRKIARAAAKAWNTEAAWAESRENGHVSAPRLRLSPLEQEEDLQDNEAQSENPDRGLSDR